MRYCPNCRRINEEWPERCRFCGLTWNVRICRRGHPNPGNAVFCGECGSGDLSATARGGRFVNAIFKAFLNISIWRLLRVLFRLTMLALPFLILTEAPDAFLPLLITVIIIIGVFNYAISILPKWMNNRVRKQYRTRAHERRDRVKRRDSRR